MKRVVVGLSGGVDSSVAAYLLQKQGWEVVGLFMRNWHDTEGTLSGDCPWRDDELFAELTAKKLDIEFHTIDLSEQYRKRVVDYMFSEYEHGRTPNPDVLCNREIKFDLFMQEAFRLGGEYVATGHYCRRTADNRLLAGVDKNKDQSYFLCQLTPEQFSHSIFPVGELTKPEVRRIATEQGLATAKRKDSQGICFVGKVDLPIFLQQQLKAKPGDIVEISTDWEGYKVQNSDFEPCRYTPQDGKKVGTHNGAHFFTIGQRKGLCVGGTKEALFVIATDVENNVVYVGQGHEHAGLMRRGLTLEKPLHWISPDKPHEGEYAFRIRYRQPLQKGRLEGNRIIFDEPQRGITAGQFAAWYDGDELVGSGVIE